MLKYLGNYEDINLSYFICVYYSTVPDMIINGCMHCFCAGEFLRDVGAVWRNVFLSRQGGGVYE